MDGVPDRAMVTNLRQFKTPAEVVVGRTPPFGSACFDIAVVAPALGRAKGVQLRDIRCAMGISRVTYALHRTEFNGALLDSVSGAETCGAVSLKLPGSSHYSKGDGATAEFSIVRIKSV